MKRNIFVLLLLLSYLLTYASSDDRLRLLNLLKQTDFYITSENFEKAAELCDQALVLFKEQGAENDANTLSALHKISHAYSEKKMFSEAVKTETVLVEVFPLAMPDNFYDYALYLHDLTLYLLNDKNIVLAEKYSNKALSLIKNENDVGLAIIYITAAEIYQETNPVRADLSIEYQKKAVDAYAYAYGKTSSKYLDELWYLAFYYEKSEDYANACNTYIDLIDLRGKVKEEKDPKILLPILDRLIFCSRKINNTELEKLCKQNAFAIKLQGLEFHEPKYKSHEYPSEKDSLDCLAIENNVRFIEEQKNKQKDDGEEIEKKLIQEEIKQYLATQPDNYGKAYFLSFESLKCVMTKDWEGAIEYGIEALRIFDDSCIKTDMYVITLVCVAEAYNELYNPAKAYDYIFKAFELRDDYLSSDNIYYNGILNDLSLFCSKLGNYNDAIKYGLMAVEAKEPDIYTKYAFRYFLSLNNLATYYGAIGQNDKELEILQYLVKRAEEIEPSVLEFEECTFLYNLAYSYLNNGDYTLAIETGLKIKKIRENLGDKMWITNIYILLARAYRFNGNIEEALYYANQAKCFQEEIGGDDNLTLAEIYDLLAMTSLDMDNYEEAERMKRYSISLIYNNITNNFVNLSSDDRTSYWYKYSGLFNIGYPHCFYKVKIDDASELYNKSALFAKGILLNADTEMSKLIMESGDEEALAKYHRLLLNRSLLSKITSGDKSQTEISVDSLRNETNKIERELIKDCKAFGDYTATMRTTWQDVQAALKANDIAIEFLSFPLLDNKDSILNKTLYAALILTKSDNAPRFIELFDEKELESIRNNSEMLYNLIWGEIEKYLSAIDNIYFSPAGKLYNINIEDLPEIVGRNNAKNYYRVSSTRLLAHQNNSQIKEEKAIIYGGLKYDASISELVADSKIHIRKDTSFRGDVENLDLRSGWDYLPETLIEVNEIESALNKRKIPTQIYTDTLGTEASFKSLDGQPCKIIHIATHGFYYPESDSAKMKKAHLDYMANQINRYSRSYIEDYSLTRSGLLMAGCNNILRGYKLPDNVDDGILFAKEIAGMNLKDVELATISSCDSGLGDVTGDGVFGLQRAFKKAGAQSILMSLHKVDDEATRILMVEFYRNLMNGKTKHQSLKNAQKYLRKVEKGKYNKPEYWASFILLDGLN